MNFYTPKISVVIPLYNKENHIRRSIVSVLNQSVDFFEILVINDGSTDKGGQIVEGIGDRRIKIYNQKNQGVSAARNRGIKEAKSDLVAFLDADDEWRTGFLEAILSLRKKFPNAGAYGTSYETPIRGGKTYYPKFPGLCEGFEGLLPSYFKASLGMHVLHTSAVAIPKNIFNLVGGFAIGEKLGEDLDMWLRIALKFPIAYRNTYLSVYHQDAGNRTDGLPISVERLPYLRRAKETLQSGDIPTDLREDLVDYVAIRKIGYAKYFILTGHVRSGRKLLKKLNTKRFQKTRQLWLLLSYIPSWLFKGLRKVKWQMYTIYKRFKNSIIKNWIR